MNALNKNDLNINIILKLIYLLNLYQVRLHNIKYYIKIFKPANFTDRKKTNLTNTGLTSADRSTKATLLLTIPSPLFKSSAKDLS